MSDGKVWMRDVTKVYHRGDESLTVLDRLTLEIPSGAFFALMGPSGSGKSTILNLIGGLDRPDSGTIEVGADEITGMSSHQLAAWRARHVGFVFQAFNLIPVLTALENVELPLLLQPLSRSERRKHAEYALEIMGLKDRMNHRPAQLSGGQEQRVAIARAIATDPSVIVADEPTGDLDRASADHVLDILRKLSADSKKTVIMVTHDPAAAEYAQRTLHLKKGAVVHEGAA